MAKLYAPLTNNPCTRWEMAEGGYLYERGGVEVTHGPSTYGISVGTARVPIYSMKIRGRVSCVLLQIEVEANADT